MQQSSMQGAGWKMFTVTKSTLEPAAPGGLKMTFCRTRRSRILDLFPSMNKLERGSGSRPSFTLDHAAPEICFTNENWKLASVVHEELHSGISSILLETVGSCLSNMKAILEGWRCKQDETPENGATTPNEQKRERQTRYSHQVPNHCVSDLGHVTLKQRGQVDDPLLVKK